MKKLYRKGLAAFMSLALLFSVSSCDIFDLDINTDPNNPSEAALNLLLANTISNASSTFAGGLNDMATGFMVQSTANDDFNMTNGTWNGTWNFLYSGPLKDLNELVVAAEAQGNNPHYLGIGQVLKAYYFSIMVDLWGDVPYSQAFQGDAETPIKEPAYDDDAAIYADLIALCDAAIANLVLPTPVAVTGDLIYNGNAARWRKAAKTLKLRLLLQTRNVNSVAADIQALVTEGDLILTAADDFQYRFPTAIVPDLRHPWYQNAYSGGEAAHGYFSHQLMYEMLANGDPRFPFYFHRQTTVVLNPDDPTDRQTIPCSQRDDCVYGYFPLSPLVTNGVFGVDPDGLSSAEAAYLAGVFGRDRADPSGIPNDNPVRTTVGAYPAGGEFDATATLGGGNRGSRVGYFPMLTSWMTKFYILEAGITLGTTYAAVAASESALLTSALTDQMNKVWLLGSTGQTVVTDESTWGTAYSWPVTFKTRAALRGEIAAAYPTAGSENVRLGYVLKQAWFANFGNGFESYNAFRRTGLPGDLQAPLQLPRQFALRLPYAQDELNLNGNTPAIVYDSPSAAVFWDTLKFQF